MSRGQATPSMTRTVCSPGVFSRLETCNLICPGHCAVVFNENTQLGHIACLQAYDACSPSAPTACWGAKATAPSAPVH